MDTGVFVVLMHQSTFPWHSLMQSGENSEHLASPWGRKKTETYIECSDFWGGLLKGQVSLLSESKHWRIRIPGWVPPETKAMVWTVAHTCHCLYLQFSTEGVAGKPQLLASPWGGKELEHVSNIPVYQGAAQDTGLCITYFKALTRSHIV